MGDSDYGLVDRGLQFLEFVESSAGTAVAHVVARHLEPARGDRGFYDIDYLNAHYRGVKEGPLHLLGSWMGYGRITLEVFSDDHFGLLERKKARKHVGELYGKESPDRAVEWVLNNATRTPPHALEVLPKLWRDAPFQDGMEDFYRHEIVRAARKWKNP